MSYADDKFKIAFAPYSSESLNFKAKNPAERTLEILWEEASVIDPMGIEMEIVLLGEEISSDLDVPPSSVLKPGEIIEARIIPRGNIYYNADTRDWRFLSLAPPRPGTHHTFDSLMGKKSF